MSVDCHKDQEQMKMKMREGRREKWNEREARLSRPSKTPEGREERLLLSRKNVRWGKEKRINMNGERIEFNDKSKVSEH